MYREGVPRGKPSVVSVRFDRESLMRVSDAAQRQGITTSEFIRRAAIGRAVHRQQAVILSVSGCSVLQGMCQNVTRAWWGVRLMTPPLAQTH